MFFDFKHRFYDSLSRLIEADYNNGANVYNYGYDVAGNMVNYDGVTRTFNEANQMVNDGTNTLVYDNNGNLIGNGVDTYTWDRANRLLSVGNHSYVYDGAGNRVQQTVSSVVTDYLNDLQPSLTKLLVQDDGTNLERFVHGVRGIHAVDNGTDWNFYAQDGLGSVRATVDDAGVVQQSMSYDLYGMPLGTLPDNFGFTGEQTDENGLNYRRARYYDPTLGIWTAEDFLETPNRYAYVDGNPVNLVDNNGLQGSVGGVLDPYWWQQGLGGIADDLAQFGDDIINWGDDIARWGAPIGRRIRSAIARRGATSFAISQLDSPLLPIADFVGLAYIVDGIVRGPQVTRAGRASEVPTYDNPSIVGQGSFSGAGVVIPPITAPFSSNAVTSQAMLDAYYRCLILNSGACNQPLDVLIPGMSVPYVGEQNDTENLIFFASQSQSNATSDAGQGRWGTCDENQYNPLKDAMTNACKGGNNITGCGRNSLKKLRRQLRQPGQRERDVIITREHIQQIIANNIACETARQIIQDTCYANSPEPRHAREIQQLKDNRSECYSMLSSL